VLKVHYMTSGVCASGQRGGWWLHDLHMCLLLFSIGVSH